MKLEEGKKKLPDGWQWVKLGDVCEVKGGKRLPERTDFAKGKTPFPYIRVIDFKDGTVSLENLKYIDEDTHSKISRYIIRSEDVYISIAGSIGMVGIIPDVLDGANLTENAARIGIKDTGTLYRDFLVKFLQSPLGQESIKVRTNIVGQPKLALTRIVTIYIPIPPIDEQKRIATILNEKMEAVERSRQATLAQLEAAKVLSSAYLRSVFNSPETQKWERKLLDEICHRITDGTHQSPNFTLQGIPFLFVKNIVSGKINFNVSQYVSKETYEELTRRCQPIQGDILFSAVGSFGVAVVIETDRPFTFQRHIALIKPKRELIDSHFLAHYLNSSKGRQQSEAVALGVAQRTVTLKALSNFEIYLPALTEQKRIAATLSEQMTEVEKLRKALEEQLDAINQLPATFLRQAFNGEL